MLIEDLKKYDSDSILCIYEDNKMSFLERAGDNNFIDNLGGYNLKRNYNYNYTQAYNGFYRSGSASQKDYLKIVNMEEFLKDHPYSNLDKFLENRANRYRGRYYSNTSDMLDKVAYMTLYCERPEIEQLCKIGLTNIVADWAIARVKGNDCSKYSRAFKKGKTIDEITRLPKYAWSRLKEYCPGNIDTWNELRIWVQKENLSIDALNEIINQNLSTKELNRLRKIAKAEYNGEKIYTLEGLLNYLHRCDVYQAIPQYQAIELLEDYISMCVKMGNEPLKTTNSLKREHDVQARNYGIWAQQQRFEKDQSGFALNSERLQKYEWSDDDYVAITPKKIIDLINEGINNHNCVGSYVSKYADGKSNIFFIRKKDSPDKSYITIELNRDCTNYLQAYLSSNLRITNPKDWSFINKWISHCKEVK